MSRSQTLDAWLRQRLAGEPFELASASEDASFRRYFRLTTREGTSIVMDAPPDHEDCRPFVKVARLFFAAGVHVPQVLMEDLDNGYLLLSDLGTTTYLQALTEATASHLYADANNALVHIQLASRAGVLPDYDFGLLLREMRLFPDWYVAKHLGIILSAAQAEVLEAAFEA